MARNKQGMSQAVWLMIALALLILLLLILVRGGTYFKKLISPFL